MILSESVFLIILALLGYLVAPAMLVWGWMRWVKQRPRSWTVPSALSFIGFALASLSALLGLWVIAFANSGRPAYAINYPLLSWGVPTGAGLSLAGLACSLVGLWRRSPARWQAPSSAIGMLAFWLLVAFT